MRRLRIRAKGLNIATLESRRRLPPGAAAAAAVALRKRE